jgi:hypothetical protein
MGIRSQNYIAVKPGVRLSPDMRRAVEGSIVQSDDVGTLIVYESNFTPMWARDGRGENCTFDLEQEVAIHRYLGERATSDFLMKRVGSEYGVRGAWKDHPFSGNADVRQIDFAYEEAGHNAIEDTRRRLRRSGETVEEAVVAGSAGNEDAQDSQHLRTRPALEMSLWQEWVLVVCTRQSQPAPTGQEWDALMATWEHGKKPLDSFDELKAIRVAEQAKAKGGA